MTTRGRYQSLMDTLSKELLCVHDNYPKNLVENHELIANWRGNNEVIDSYSNNVNFETVD